jgi:PIN domain
MIVVDANILVRAVLDKRMKSLLETYAGREARLFTPEVAFHDIQKSLPEILAKRSKSGGDLSAGCMAVMKTTGQFCRRLSGSAARSGPRMMIFSGPVLPGQPIAWRSFSEGKPACLDEKRD